MANDEFGDKSELPTERRRSEARERGNVARSTDLTAAGLMLAAACAILLCFIPLAKAMATVLQRSLTGPAWTSIDHIDAVREFWILLRMTAGSLGILLLLMTAAALGLNLMQVGFLIAPEVLQPKLGNLNPLQGMQRIFNVRALVRLAGSLAKLAIVTAIAALFVYGLLPQCLALMGAEPPQIMLSMKDSASTLGFELASALVLLALLDFLFQRWKHEQDLRMTKQEIREEMKSMEGDPQIRHRRREAHRKLAQAREMQAVRDADVVITNPTHVSVAIKYDPDLMPAPKVIAKGMGEIALRIRVLAAEHGVPIIERKELARALYKEVKVGHFIPADMYEVFVEIMAYVYRISGRTPTSLRDGDK